MALTLIACTFPLFCPVFEPCTEVQKEVPTQIKARIQDGVSIAEFWTPAAPAHLPWPAAVLESSFGSRTWTLFTAGDLHGAWMMSIDKDTGVAHLSHHTLGRFAGTDIFAARGTCTIQEEAA